MSFVVSCREDILETSEIPGGSFLSWTDSMRV